MVGKTGSPTFQTSLIRKAATGAVTGWGLEICHVVLHWSRWLGAKGMA